jgi:hypothetical protein
LTAAIALVLVVWAGPVLACGWIIAPVTDNDVDDGQPRVSGTNVAWIHGSWPTAELWLRDGSGTHPMPPGLAIHNHHISGSSVVWETGNGMNYGDYAAFLYDGASTTTLSKGNHNECQPRISGSRVVWRQTQPEVPDTTAVFLYDGSSTTQVIDYAFHVYNVDVSASNIVWRSLEVFLYDGTSTRQLTDNGYEEYGCRASGPWAAWLGNDLPEVSDDQANIYLYHGSTTRRITGSTGDRDSPLGFDMCGCRLVWPVWNAADQVDIIYLYDGASTTELFRGRLVQHGVRVSESLVTWSAWDGQDYEIFVYTGSSIDQLTDNACDDISPDVSGRTVVWSGWDGHDWEVYMATPEPATLALLTLGGLALLCRRNVSQEHSPARRHARADRVRA